MKKFVPLEIPLINVSYSPKTPEDDKKVQRELKWAYRQLKFKCITNDYDPDNGVRFMTFANTLYLAAAYGQEKQDEADNLWQVLTEA